MRMLPRIFGEGFLDDFIDPIERYLPVLHRPIDRDKEIPALMKTDLKENNGNYEISMDLPGVKKENVKIELEDGYMSITACSGSDIEENDSEHNYIKRERYRGEYKRSFFVGENIEKEDIKAKFENGVLYITFPKKDPKKLENDKIIEIE